MRYKKGRRSCCRELPTWKHEIINNLRRDKLKIILQFLLLLSPEIPLRADQVNAIFDVLCDKKKHFRSLPKQTLRRSYKA
jgi:hypothetical protein